MMMRVSVILYIRLRCFVNNRFAQDPNRCVYVKQPLDPLNWNTA